MNAQTNPYDLPVWEHPGSYFGFSPDGDFYLHTQDRDSDVTTRSNYESFKKLMEEKEKEFDAPEDDGNHNQGGSWVYEFQANCSLNGWRDHLLLRHDAPDKLQAEAYEILGGLENYPIIDEEDLGEREREDEDSTWNFTICSNVGSALQHYEHPLCHTEPYMKMVPKETLDESLDLCPYFRYRFNQYLGHMFGEHEVERHRDKDLEDYWDDLDGNVQRKLFDDVCSDHSVYWEHSSEGAWIRFEDVDGYSAVIHDLACLLMDGDFDEEG